MSPRYWRICFESGKITHYSKPAYSSLRVAMLVAMAYRRAGMLATVYGEA